MEVKFNKQEVTNESKKLSYEQLENAAKQISVQAEALAKENVAMRKMLEDRNFAYSNAVLEYNFRVLEHAEFFEQDFIDEVVNTIKTALTPAENKEREENSNESTKG